MNKIKLLIAGIGVSGVLFLLPVLGFGQAAMEPSYEVSLQIVSGSNDANLKGGLPTNLSNLSQKLKTSYTYSNYRLVETVITRMSNQGEFQYKSGTNIGADMGNFSQSFLEMTIASLKSGLSAKGTPGFQIQSIRIGARVPVATGSKKDEDGRERAIYNYEQIGNTVVKLGLGENIPTLIGSLTMPGSKETIFLVMTVKPVDL